VFRHGRNMAGGGRPKSPYQSVPQDSKPSVAKALANRGGLRLQTADDQSLSRSCGHVEPAAKQPAARCFSEGETLRNSETSLLTPQTQQLPCPIHCQYLSQNSTDRTATVAVSDSAKKQRGFEKEIFERKKIENTFFGLHSGISLTKSTKQSLHIK